MRPPFDICPLMAIANIGSSSPSVCPGNRCAWWSCMSESCCIASGADSIQDTANQIAALTISLEELTSKSQTFGILQNNGLPGATNTEQAKGGKQTLTDAVSASTITENGGFVK